ncbi:helix-turn-helix transcriptional regulator [Tardiphaga sp. 20_F10_N6_6]|uniref:helix-turn-helix transcriptional regulator n=1 Tax=Tardiphaga sp. 20_F10_N6_6 TaxID=3240788 RepID=UPI003F8C5E63
MDQIIDQLKPIAKGLGETFAPFCEVVLRDLTHPQMAILAIHNDFSAQDVGESATQMTLARLADPECPQVVANYASSFVDGRGTKSTIIRIKNSNGEYVAALCLNVNLVHFAGLQRVIEQFVRIEQNPGNPPGRPTGAASIRVRIDQYAAQLATPPIALKAIERRRLLLKLEEAGCLEIRRSVEVIAAYLRVSRATIYCDVKRIYGGRSPSE